MPQNNIGGMYTVPQQAINNQYTGFQNWAAQNPYTQPMQYQMPTQQVESQPQAQNRVNSSRVWVQGEGSAKAYIVSRNTEQVLWDSEQPSIYIKTVDENGRPNTVILDYTIRNPEPENNGNSKLEAEVAELKLMMKELMDQNKNRNNYNPNYNNKKKGGEE